MLVDTHTHFYDDWLFPDAEAAIQRALDAGVSKMIQADIDSSERPRMWEIGRRHPGVLFQMAGFYPGSVRADNWRDELDLVYRIVAGDFSTSLEMTGPGTLERTKKDALERKGTPEMAGDFSTALEMTGPGMPEMAGTSEMAGDFSTALEMTKKDALERKGTPEMAGDFSTSLEMTGDFSTSLEMTGPGTLEMTKKDALEMTKTDALERTGTSEMAGDFSTSLEMTGADALEMTKKGALERKGTSEMRIVAIGEIGLDYHEGREYEKEQKEVLRAQLELASAKDLPVNIHLRDAWEDFLTILKDTRHLHLRGNLHCFSGSYELYREANRYGDWAVGIGGVVTFKNSRLADTLAKIPLEHILLETDTPYLAPGKHRGERNESAYLPLIALKVAEVKGIGLEECAAITTLNAETLFNLK